MEKYDLIMLAILTAATMLGAWQGMAWQLASIASVVFSYMMACAFREPVAALIPVGPPWNLPLAMLSLYIGTSLVVWVLFQVVARFIDRMKLKEFDRQVGALMGLAKGVLLCAIVTLFSLSLLEDSGRQSVIHSYSGYCIAVLFDRADPFIPAEISDRLGPLLQQLGSARQPAPDPPPRTDPAIPVPLDFPQLPIPANPWPGDNPQFAIPPYNPGSSDGAPQYGGGWPAGQPGYVPGTVLDGGLVPVPDTYRSASDPRPDEGYRR